MDPLTGAIAGLVIMFFVRHAVAVVIWIVAFVLAGVVAENSRSAGGAGFILFLGFVGVVVWEIFAWIHIIGDFIRVTQLAG
jgi:hypothetical protein